MKVESLEFWGKNGMTQSATAVRARLVNGTKTPTFGYKSPGACWNPIDLVKSKITLIKIESNGADLRAIEFYGPKTFWGTRPMIIRIALAEGNPANS